ncbi:MAG: DUF58 domain-containing protein [Bacteroidales bacterium]|nr:DUF58 domain-containing protein [Bacteroidales bacterium]
MNSSELLKKVRKIEIKTKGLSRNIFAGQYHSSFKGRGMSFSEVREYQYGDDIRSIDWNVTARFGHPYIKIFEEERELTVVLLIDISNSGMFGSDEIKRQYLAEVAAVLAFSAIHNDDKIGVIFFTDKVEKFIPPKKGRKHILLIIRELLACEPKNTKTDVGQALIFLNSAIKKRATVFMMSDFISPDFSKPLKVTSYKHDLIGLLVYDKYEEQMPKVGLINAFDPETGEERWINTNNKKQREKFENWWKNHQTNLTQTLAKANVSLVKIRTDMDYVKPLVHFFKSR